MMSNYSIPVTPVTSGNTGGFGGNDGFLIFALLVLFGGGGFGGNRGNAGSNEMTGFQMGELSGKVATKDSVQMLTNSVDTQFAQTNQNLFNVREQLSNGLSTVTFELSNRINAVASAVTSCCCEIKYAMAEGFGQVRYDMANFAASINANGTANTQKVLDALANNKAEAQAARITQLELQAAMCGVVKYPNAQTYNAGPFPFGNHCGC